MNAKAFFLGAFALLSVSACDVMAPALAAGTYNSQMLLGASKIVENAYAGGARKSVQEVRTSLENYLKVMKVSLPATFSGDTGTITVLRLEQKGNELVAIYTTPDSPSEGRFSLYTAGSVQ
jgi:hypothetical protein